jgi:hypothetical protein
MPGNIAGSRRPIVKKGEAAADPKIAFCKLARSLSMAGRLPLITFDVNETLLDLESVAPIFSRIFGDGAVMRLWFADLILYSEALTLAGVYAPFTDIGAAVLAMLAKTRGITISDSDKANLTNTFATMPPHPRMFRRPWISCAKPASVSLR